MAYSLDRRVQSGINGQALPKQRKLVLDAVENAGNPGQPRHLPSTWLSWTRAHQSELLKDFPTLFTDDLDQSSGQELVTRLEQLITERKRLTSEVRKLRKRFKDLAHRPEESLTNKEREGAYIRKPSFGLVLWSAYSKLGLTGTFTSWQRLECPDGRPQQYSLHNLATAPH